MTLGRDIHMLSCSKMFFDEPAAQELALSMGIEGAPIHTGASINFIIGPRRDFRDVWMDRRKGFYLLRGKRGKGDLLHKRNGEVGAHAAEGKEAARVTAGA